MQRYKEVIIFAVGLMKEPKPLVQHVYEMQVEGYLNEMRTGYYGPSIDTHLLKSLHVESTVWLFDHPLHNKNINYYNHGEDEVMKRALDTTPVYYPSGLYLFDRMRHRVELEDHLTESTEIPPCAMYISQPHSEVVKDILLSTCHEISKYQAVTNLRMEFVTSKDLTLMAPHITNPQSVILDQCSLPNHFLMTILHQLLGCGHTLQYLQLYNMDLKPYEVLLDELMEDLLGHHGTDLAVTKLMLRLGYNNLSLEFVEKWKERCREMDSIDCMIHR